MEPEGRITDNGVWERYERIEAERILRLIEHIYAIPADLRDITDEQVLTVLEDLRRVEQLPTEFN